MPSPKYQSLSAAATAMLALAVTPLHIRVLQKIDSPLWITAVSMLRGPEAHAKFITENKGKDFQEGTRETLFVMLAPFGKLKRLESASRDEIRTAALAAVPESRNYLELAEVQAAIARHADPMLNQILNQKGKKI